MILPRTTLREPAFRRFEPYLAQALVAPLEHDPKAEGLTQEVWLRQARDARLAFVRYGYTSARIPRHADLWGLRFLALENGLVRIEPAVWSTIPTPAMAPTADQTWSFAQWQTLQPSIGWVQLTNIDAEWPEIQAKNTEAVLDRQNNRVLLA